MRSAFCLFSLLAISVGSTAQGPLPLHLKISAMLGRMKDKHLTVREVAFADMMSLLSGNQPQPHGPTQADVFSSFCTSHPEEADRVRLGLIQLLSVEDDTFIKGKPGSLTEGDGEYYAEVIDAVSSLDDERAIPALVGAMTTGGMVQRGLLKYGDKALGPMMVQLTNSDALVRATALGMTTALLERRDDSESRVRTKDLIRSFLKDPSLVVREQAVNSIDCLDDRQQFVSVLERIAKTDPDKFPGQKALDGGDGEAFYPARYAARQVLRDIKDNRTCRQ